MDKKKTILLFVRIVLLIIIIICLIRMGQTYYLSIRHQQQQKTLSQSVKTTQNQPLLEQTQTENQNMIPTAENYFTESASASDLHTENNLDKTAVQKPEILEQYQTLYNENQDLIGWLSIPDTNIDYPVMQCNDNEYYLHHNFYREEDKYGCLYVKDIADVNTPATNFIIYGHNMKDGSMFGNLDQYQEQTFYQEHPFIQFHTLYEERTYQVLAVFYSQVYQKDENVFKYYQFYQANTEAEFWDFYENIMTSSLITSDVTATFGDTFLTLSTCAYHVEDGRFVVVAKRIN